MKTYVHLWYLAKFFLKWDVSDKCCRENQNTHVMSSDVFLKLWRFWDIVEKYGTAGQATDGNIKRCMRIACRITVATNTERICNTLAFPWKNFYANTPTRYITRTSVYMSLIYTSKCLLFLQLFHEKTFVIISRNLVIKSVRQVLPVSLEVLCNIRANKQPSYFVSVTERNFYGPTNVVPCIPTDIGKYSFVNRSIADWNQLPKARLG